ncbi:MAG: helix-turn-helix transcriptional regulator [Clostridia bacterium]|nr:helix-turn-helix transcriptional regulator [Clostridia bacterium]
MKYNERLRNLREDLDMTQTDVAKLFNVGQKTVSNWESGRNEPPYDILIKYASFFNVTTDYLLGISDDPQK